MNHINNNFGSINNRENNIEHSKKSSGHIQFDEHEGRYGGLGMGEETPLLKKPRPSSVPLPFDNSLRKKQPLYFQQKQQHLQRHSLSNSYTGLRNLQDYVVSMNNLDSNETNSYDETDSDNGTANASSSATTLQQQNDACFPMAESAGFKRPTGIDYEALENYVKVENEKRRNQQRRRQRRLSEPASAFVRKKSNNHCPNLEINKHNSEILYRLTFYSAIHSTVHARTLAEIPSADSSLSEMLKDGCWWIDVLSPTDEEMKEFGKIFGIHPLTIEDIETEETREKCEIFKDYYFICFRSFDQDHYSSTYLQPVIIYIIVMKEGVLSFHFHPTPHPANVRRRIRQLKDYITVTPDSFAPLIQKIEIEVDSIDELVLMLKECEQTDMLRRIGHCRKRVLGLLRLLGSKADVMKALIKRCYELRWDVFISNEILLYLGDIQDHVITMVQNLNHYEKILSRSHSNYLAQISIEMTEANNQINDVLSRLTALGTILIPMNLVTGLWGMNVPVPGQESEGLTWFISILAGIIVFAISGVIMAHRTGICE
ncbi:3136_t:CDS:2 [Entrophospora sp. SA101]|nr:11568_t:CDS:2 [Entrophospora sp. SA101]CAJ0642824.1 3136_t:CDS:2 [Entrophospora sp. SA101]CAJ0893733.1 3646_t:CDS:2 [Entrophospora sp. SA101]CAJ0911103.1 10441_t:CDS:2 [Entrophospora sp. SA101]